jgi:prepilin-type N-terminal cleavage/methylation domain-containing protein
MKMKTIPSRRAGLQGLTLIEMIGVLAIIAVLAAILAPKVFTAVAYNHLKTACVDYYAKSGSFPLRDGTGSTNAAIATGRFDADLLAGSFLERLFSCSVGSQLNDLSTLTGRTHVRSLTAVSNATVSVTATTGGDNFDLDGNASTADFTSANTVVSVFIPGVVVIDAVELNKLIDRATNTDTTAADVSGRCLYSTPSGGTTTVYIYVAHQ